MQWRNTVEKYGIVTKLLHGLIALLMIAQMIIALVMKNISGVSVGQWYFVHKSLGLTLLFLAVLFIFWGCINRKPAWQNTMPRWQSISAHVVHFCLYALVFIMPLSGWIMSSAAGYAPSFWGWFTVAAPVAKNPALVNFCSDVHTVCAWMLGGLIIIHLLAVIKHAVIDRDAILRRML